MAELVEESKIVRNVLVVIAMEAEARPFIESQHLSVIPNAIASTPSIIYSSGINSDGNTLSVVMNGKCNQHSVDNVGTVPAALSTFLAINQLQPDIVINAGTCGGFKAKGSNICDSYISSATCNHDRRIPIPGFIEYGIWANQSHTCPNLVQALGLKTGVVTTSNSLDHTEMDDKLMLENDATCKDMEAASVAWACSLTNTPFLALKVVTDIVDGDRPTQEEFMENLHAAAKTLQEKLPLIVGYVTGKRLEEL